MIFKVEYILNGAIDIEADTEEEARAKWNNMTYSEIIKDAYEEITIYPP